MARFSLVDPKTGSCYGEYPTRQTAELAMHGEFTEVLPTYLFKMARNLIIREEIDGTCNMGRPVTNRRGADLTNANGAGPTVSESQNRPYAADMDSP